MAIPPSKHLRTLGRRRDHLTRRLRDYHTAGNPDLCRAELAALTWAMRIVLAARQEGLLDDLEAVPVAMRGGEPFGS